MMTREQRKDLLEGIGFVAIVASLIFVGIETRNSTKQAVLTTRTLEISAYQELMDNVAELNTLAVQDAEVAAFLYKAMYTTDRLSDLEQFRLNRNLYQRFRHGDIAYFQFERGVISETRLRSALKVLDLGNPRIREFWSRRQGNFVEPYRNFVNRLIDEIESERGGD